MWKETRTTSSSLYQTPHGARMISGDDKTTTGSLCAQGVVKKAAVDTTSTEEKAPGHGQQGRSLDGARFQTSPFCYIFDVEQWGFHCTMTSGHREGGPRSSFALGRTCAAGASTTLRPSPRIEDGQGAAAPRSATDSTEKWV